MKTQVVITTPYQTITGKAFEASKEEYEGIIESYKIFFSNPSTAHYICIEDVDWNTVILGGDVVKQSTFQIQRLKD